MIKKSISTFKQEFRKSTNTAIVAAFGFLIALSWRDLITEYVNKISAYSLLQGQLISTLIITAVSVLGIVLATKIFSDKEKEASQRLFEALDESDDVNDIFSNLK